MKPQAGKSSIPETSGSGEYYGSKSLLAIQWTVSLLLVAISVWGIFTIDVGGHYFGLDIDLPWKVGMARAILVGCAAYFALYVALISPAFLTNGPLLVIDESGCWISGRTRQPLPWSRIKGFKIYKGDSLFGFEEIRLIVEDARPYMRSFIGFMLRPTIQTATFRLPTSQIQSDLRKHTSCLTE